MAHRCHAPSKWFDTDSPCLSHQFEYVVFLHGWTQTEARTHAHTHTHTHTHAHIAHDEIRRQTKSVLNMFCVTDTERCLHVEYAVIYMYLCTCLIYERDFDKPGVNIRNDIGILTLTERQFKLICLIMNIKIKGSNTCV